MPHSTSAADTAPTAPMCQISGTCSQTMSAPTSAPSTVPPLKAAWNHGMIDRPRPRSMMVPSRFCATSQTPVPSPSRNRLAATAAIGRPICTPDRGQHQAGQRDHHRGPDGAGGAEASGDEPGERQPAQRAGGHRQQQQAELPGLSANSSLTSGTRDIQDANANPFTANTTKSPLRALITVARPWVVSAGA